MQISYISAAITTSFKFYNFILMVAVPLVVLASGCSNASKTVDGLLPFQSITAGETVKMAELLLIHRFQMMFYLVFLSQTYYYFFI